MKALLLSALVAARLAGAAPARPPDPAADPRPLVAAVELYVPAGEDRAGVEGLVAIRSGERLSPRALRRTVQLLYQLGHFSNVVIRAEPAPAGAAQGAGAVILHVDCLPRRVVHRLSFAVDALPAAIDDEKLRKAAGLAEGDEYSPERVERAVQSVRAAYARRGFRAAEVKAVAGGERDVSLVVRVAQGRPTRVGTIRLGDGGAALAGDLLAGISTRPGAVLDLDVLEEDRRRIGAALRARGFYRSRLGPPRIDGAGETAAVEFPVDPGPRIGFRFSGNATVPTARLRSLLGYEGEPLDEATLAGLADRLRAYYQARGWFAARISPSVRESPAEAQVLFRLEEGRRYRVGEVRFVDDVARGEAWARTRLGELLEAQAPPDEDVDQSRLPGFERTSRGPPRPDPRDVYDEPLWTAAVKSLVVAYRSDGYLKASHEGTRLVVDARRGVIDVEVRLRTGIRTRVESISFEGNSALPLPELAREARLAPGDPLQVEAIEQTRAALAALYARHGFAYARVEDVEEVAEDGATAALRYRVEEGPRVRIGSVLVAGNKRTREEVVLGSLALRPGDFYDPEAVAKSQAELLRLGVFRSVGLRLSDPDVAEAAKDLTVEVTERPWQTIASGAGFSIANGPRAFLEFSEPNLLGRALELSSHAKVNYPLVAFRSDLLHNPDGTLRRPIDRIEGRVDVGLHASRLQFLALPVGARLDAIGERLHRLAYDLSRGSAVAGLDAALSSRITLSLQYELEVDDIQPTELLNTCADRPENCTLTRLDVERLRFPKGVTTLQSLRPVLALDFRDNSTHPRRGWFASGALELVRSIGTGDDRLLWLIPGSQSHINMVKLSGTASGYLPLGSKNVLALSVRGGRVLPLDPDSVTIGPKRFFLGGAGSLRSFAEDEMIPEDRRADLIEQVRSCRGSLSGLACSALAKQLASGQSVPSEGGEAFLLVKAELRVPVRQSVEAGLFIDAGNLWLDPRNVSLLELRVGIGAGLRFVTPIGPAAVDVGVNLQPDPRLNERVFAPHFSIGLF